MVIVCGGRDYRERGRVFAALDLAHARDPITLVMHGACADSETGALKGVDRWANEWATERGIRVEPHPADWTRWGGAAGPVRNKRMAEIGAHNCIAFPGRQGTSSMIREAEQFGITVWRPFVWPAVEGD